MRTKAWLMAALGLAACLPAARPAAAQSHPPLMRPTRDVMVDYRVVSPSGGQQRTNIIRMYFSDHGMKMRMEPVGHPGYSIVDRTTGRMILVMTQQHLYMEMPYDDKRLMPFDSNDTAFVRRGTDTVAGISCTVYDGKQAEHSGQMCLTDDGLLLRGKSNDPARAGDGLEAIRVVYASQPASLFAPPPDFRKMDHDSMGHAAPH